MPFGMPEYQGPGQGPSSPPPFSTEQSQPSAAPTDGGAPSGAAPSGGAPAGAAPTGAPQSLPGQSGTQPTQAQLLELDKHEKFRFKGREYTLKEWEDGHLRQADYSKKTAEVAERAKYTDNFAADLEKVWQEPEKWFEQFERLYPPQYVALAKTILSKREAAKSQESANPPAPTSPSLKDHPEFQALQSEIGEWKKSQQIAQTKANRAWLDNQHETLGSKHPFAHKELVEARLSAHAERYGGKSITAKLMGETYEAVNAELKKRSDELTKSVITKQINAGRDARDVGAGGDAPTAAPHQYKTMKEAREAMLRDIEKSKR